MSLKESLRKYTVKYQWFEKVWLVLQWKNTKRKAKKYSDYDYAQYLWKKHQGRGADFENPKTFNEKLWFLKLSNRDPLLTICSDKHAVRQYVIECGYEDILKKEYACFNNANEIDFTKLPELCYLKCNHASGMNFVYQSGRKYNTNFIKWKFNFLLNQNPYYLSREWNYKNISPKIVCEEVLSMPDGVSDIPELQFFCFHGEPRFIMYNLGLADEEGRHKRALRWVFDLNWNIIPVKTSMPTGENKPEKPLNYQKMIKIAQDLSAPFPHVRVDLFNINGKIVFNELTFYSGGGFVKLEPEIWQKKIGDMIDCSSYHISPDAYEVHCNGF